MMLCGFFAVVWVFWGVWFWLGGGSFVALFNFFNGVCLIKLVSLLQKHIVLLYLKYFFLEMVFIVMPTHSSLSPEMA